MTKDEALRLALEALGWTDEWRPQGLREEAIIKCKEALAQPAQEPVAWKFYLDGCNQVVLDEDSDSLIRRNGTPLYTTPPKRPWVGLTDEKIAEVAERMEASDPTDSFWREFARAIEAAHNIGVNT